MPSFHQHLIYQNYLNQCQSFWFYSKCILIIKPRITTVALILCTTIGYFYHWDVLKLTTHSVDFRKISLDHWHSFRYKIDT